VELDLLTIDPKVFKSRKVMKAGVQLIKRYPSLNIYHPQDIFHV